MFYSAFLLPGAFGRKKPEDGFAKFPKPRVKKEKMSLKELISSDICINISTDSEEFWYVPCFIVSTLIWMCISFVFSDKFKTNVLTEDWPALWEWNEYQCLSNLHICSKTLSLITCLKIFQTSLIKYLVIIYNQFK